MGAKTLDETLIQNASQCEDESVESRKVSVNGSMAQQQHLQERKQSLKLLDSSAPTQEETNQWSHEETYENYIELYKYCEVCMSMSVIGKSTFVCVYHRR